MQKVFPEEGSIPHSPTRRPPSPTTAAFVRESPDNGAGSSQSDPRAQRRSLDEMLDALEKAETGGKEEEMSQDDRARATSVGALADDHAENGLERISMGEQLPQGTGGGDNSTSLSRKDKQVTYSFVQVNTWCDSDDDLLAKASKDGGADIQVDSPPLANVTSTRIPVPLKALHDPIKTQGTLKRDLPSGMSGWDLLGEEEMWDRAISHSTKRLGETTKVFVKEASHMKVFKVVSFVLRITGINAPNRFWAIYARLLLCYELFRLSGTVAYFFSPNCNDGLHRLGASLMLCWVFVCVGVQASLLASWRKLDLMLAIHDLTDSNMRHDLISHVIKNYAKRVLPVIMLPGCLALSFTIVLIGSGLRTQSDGVEASSTRLSDIFAYPHFDQPALIGLALLLHMLYAVQQFAALSLFVIMLTFVHIRFRELFRRINDESITMAGIYQAHYDLCRRIAKIDYRFRHFTTACLLGYMGFFLFALNLLFTQRGTQTMLVPLLAVCCSTWSAAVLVAFVFFTMRIAAWHDKLFNAAFDRPDQELSLRTMRQGDTNERMHRLLSWRLKEFQPCMTVFNGSFRLTSRFFVKSGSAVMTAFYLAVQMQRNNASSQ